MCLHVHVSDHFLQFEVVPGHLPFMGQAPLTSLWKSFRDLGQKGCARHRGLYGVRLHESFHHVCILGGQRRCGAVWCVGPRGMYWMRLQRCRL